MESPRFIEFPAVGSAQIGFLSIAEQEKLVPFEIKRVFWCYQTPESVVRGNHAHYQLQQVIIALTGKVEVTCETPDGNKTTFLLDSPRRGLLLPRLHWHTITFSPDTVVLALASLPYLESDYIRDYNEFRKLTVNA